MGDGFQVDLGELAQVTTTLDHAADDMRSANGSLRDASARDLGSLAIDAAGRGFQDRWEYGIGKIAEASEKMVEALRKTQQLYEEIDRATAEMFPDVDADADAGRQGPTDCGWGNAVQPSADGGRQGPTDCGWDNAVPLQAAARDVPPGNSAITQALSGAEEAGR